MPESLAEQTRFVMLRQGAVAAGSHNICRGEPQPKVANVQTASEPLALEPWPTQQT
jgi:hypothetical protein